MHQVLDQKMPSFNLPSKILCKVVHVQLRVSFQNHVGWLHFHMSTCHMLCFSCFRFSYHYYFEIVGRTRYRWGLCTDYFVAWTKCKLSFFPFSLYARFNHCFPTIHVQEYCLRYLFVNISPQYLSSFSPRLCVLIVPLHCLSAKWSYQPRSSTTRASKVHSPFILQDSNCFWHEHTWGILCSSEACWWLPSLVGEILIK